MTPASKHLAALLVAAMLITVSVGCEAVRFGVSATHEGSTITASYGDGKTIIEAEQDGSKVGLNFRR
jgi:hypothetical protein